MKCTVHEIQERLNSSEFVEWIVFLDDLEWRTRTKQEYYMANLILRITQAFSGTDDNGNSLAANLKTEDMLMSFTPSIGDEDGWEIAENDDADVHPMGEDSSDDDDIVMGCSDQEHIWRGAMSFAKTKGIVAKEKKSKLEEAKQKAKEKMKAKADAISARKSDAAMPAEKDKIPLRRKRRGK